MARKIIELNDFTLRGNGICVSARVPGDILNDLRRGGAVPPFDLDDEYEKVRWVQEKDWDYETMFSLRGEDLQGELTLEFYGIDTFAEVYVNGTLLGKTENMFLKYSFDLKNCARASKNALRVHMVSPMERLRSRVNDKYVCVFNKDRLFWRKAQCHYGWDWAPELAGYGLYEPVRLVVHDRHIIEDLTIRTRLSGDITVFAQLGYSVFRDEREYAGRDVLELCVFEYASGKEVASRRFPINRKKNLINIRIPEPKLWWPNTYGEPNLYTLTAVLLRDGKELDRAEERFGIRSVRLVEEPIGEEDRLSCRLQINGQNVYCKGSNWVPLDFQTGMLTDERYRKSIALARDGNFNMLRVWGGGLYEKDAFYRYCDEYGVMVMQEFMISCSDVPEDDPAFAKLLSEEAEYQVKRLKNRPSIVLWSGGNERATAFCAQEDDTNSFLSDYAFRGMVNKHIYGVPYVDHSPWSYTDVDDDEMSGDSHWSCMDKAIAQRDIGNYRDYLNKKVTAFTAECAALGPARMRSMKKFLSPAHLWPVDEVWEKRFRCNPTDKEGMNFAYWVETAADRLFGKADDAADLVKKGMTAQYEILFDEILFLRANNFYNGGFLNWMFGDIWGTGTWSVVDYWSEPKGGYYGMKRAFAPFLIGFIKDVGGAYRLCAVNDTNEPKKGVFRYGIKTLGGDILAAFERETEVAPHASLKISLPKELDASGYWFAEFCGESVSYFPRYWKGMEWKSDFQSEIYETEKGVAVHIEAKSFLRKVFLSAAEGKEARFDDNLFDMQAGESRTVSIFGSDLSAKDIKIFTFADSWID